MLPQTQPRVWRNSQRVNLLISLGFHAVIVLALIYFAAREGLLGKQLKKIAVEMVKEKAPEKPKEPEKPKPEPPKVQPPKVEPPKVALAPRPEPARTETRVPPPATVAPPPVAPPAAEVPAFVFDGGKTVESSSDPVELYRSAVEASLRARWAWPPDLAENNLVTEVEVSVDRGGRVSDPTWKKSSGQARWDDSVRRALAATPTIGRPPPPQFPGRVLVRFDVQDATEPLQP